MTTESIERLHFEMRNSLDAFHEILLHSVNLELILDKETKTRKLNEKITRLLGHWISKWERTNFDDTSKIYRKFQYLVLIFNRQWRDILMDNGVAPIDMDDREYVNPFAELVGDVLERWSAKEKLL